MDGDRPLNVHVLYFAVVRERLRKSSEPLTLPAGTTVAGALQALAARHPALSGMLPALRVAVNEDFAPLDQVLRDGDEVALIPPVSGGAAEGPYARLSHAPIVVNEVIDAVSAPERGGVVTFTGAVRDHSHGQRVQHLIYEAYEPMALRTMRALAAEIEAALPGVKLALVHRLGLLQVGEVAVVIAAAAPHRAAAFTACQRAIDTLKQTVPIWKKEITAAGETWVSPTP